MTRRRTDGIELSRSSWQLAGGKKLKVRDSRSHNLHSLISNGALVATPVSLALALCNLGYQQE
jgi:hypothetical protein